ncbi:MAG: DDE-type integrase/transposase/recombinase [Dehalogenimonas sp.]
MIQNPPACKNCGSDDVVKWGAYKTVPRFYCKACNRKYKADGSLFHMKVPADHISSALNQYYTGMSIGDIALILKQEHDYLPSKRTIYRWIDKYTEWAVNQFKDERPKVGDVWIADETALDIDGRKVWLWDIIDRKTRYLLATRISDVRRTQDAEALMQAAAKRAGKAPKQVLTDHLTAYLDGVGVVFGGKTEHIRSNPFVEGADSTSDIERFHNTLKDRTKVMRGFRDIATLAFFIDGFQTHYNHFRPHEGLKYKTPADVAKVSTDCKTWFDVCALPVSKRQELKTHHELTLKQKKVMEKPAPKPPREYHRKNPSTGITIKRVKMPNLGNSMPAHVRRELNYGLPKDVRRRLL